MACPSFVFQPSRPIPRTCSAVVPRVFARCRHRTVRRTPDFRPDYRLVVDELDLGDASSVCSNSALNRVASGTLIPYGWRRRTQSGHRRSRFRLRTRPSRVRSRFPRRLSGRAPSRRHSSCSRRRRCCFAPPPGCRPRRRRRKSALECPTRMVDAVPCVTALRIRFSKRCSGGRRPRKQRSRPPRRTCPSRYGPVGPTGDA